MSARVRTFADYTAAEDWVNDLVFGGDDPDLVGELTEVWPDADSFDKANLDGAWGQLRAVVGTDAEVDAALEDLGPYRDDKGRTARPQED